MLFKYEPNQSIIQTITQKQTGKKSKFVVCKFDENGELETNDEKIIYILQNKLHGCTWTGDKVEATAVIDVLSDKDIRQLAKDKGIKSWHVKKIETLKEEIASL